ncbi:hypothetical protein CBL_01248 [Carabus blaptoides fortunei]
MQLHSVRKVRASSYQQQCSSSTVNGAKLYHTTTTMSTSQMEASESPACMPCNVEAYWTISWVRHCGTDVEQASILAGRKQNLRTGSDRDTLNGINRTQSILTNGPSTAMPLEPALHYLYRSVWVGSTELHTYNLSYTNIMQPTASALHHLATNRIVFTDNKMKRDSFLEIQVAAAIGTVFTLMSNPATNFALHVTYQAT